MTGIEIKNKTGLKMKMDILGIIYDKVLELRDTEYESPFNEYLKNTKIQILTEIHQNILEMSVTENGG